MCLIHSIIPDLEAKNKKLRTKNKLLRVYNKRLRESLLEAQTENTRLWKIIGDKK